MPFVYHSNSTFFQLNYERTNIYNAILNISLKPVPLRTQLENILMLLYSLPMVNGQGGFVFLAEHNQENLSLIAAKSRMSVRSDVCSSLSRQTCLCSQAAKKRKILWARNGNSGCRNPDVRGLNKLAIPIGKKKLHGLISVFSQDEIVKDANDKEFWRSVSEIIEGIITHKKYESEVKWLVSIPEDHPMPIIEISSEGTLVYMNQSTLNILNENNLTVSDISKILPPKFADAVNVCREQNSPLDTVSFTIKDRILIWQLYPNAHNQNVRAYALDITDQLKAQEVMFLANHDSLTKLINRSLLNEKFKTTLGLARRKNFLVAVLYLDLDNFKPVNDTLGHKAGDLLLIELANRLKKCIRSSDLASRIGGDEFIVILSPITVLSDAQLVAENIMRSVNKPYVIFGQKVSVGCSIGISTFPADGDNPEVLLAAADYAMYYAKKNNKNNIKFYSPFMKSAAEQKIEMEKELRNAIQQRELVVYYQPQVDLTTNRIIGMETLVRWHHPKKGLLFPDEFLPVARETKLIHEIDKWVLETACVQNKIWQDKGLLPVPLAVNFSSHFIQHDLCEKNIIDILDAMGYPYQYLECEITEDLILQDITAKINNLKKKDISIAIDDFGTGYSSLSKLKYLPVNKLKIDKSFVQNITHDYDDEIIIATIINMAKTLNLNVIAEGVETENQVQVLTKYGCFQAQGYLFSQPVSAVDMEALLHSENILPR